MTPYQERVYQADYHLNALRQLIHDGAIELQHTQFRLDCSEAAREQQATLLSQLEQMVWGRTGVHQLPLEFDDFGEM